MRIALISDLHGQLKTLQYVENILSKDNPEGVIISGDISSNGDVEFINKLFVLFGNKDVFLVCGNADQMQAKEMLENSKYSINQKCKRIGQNKICGLSYGEEYLNVKGELKDSILVTHIPPQRALLDKIYPNSPKYHISGHLHKTAFVKKYPTTIHIQVPTLQDGKYGVFDLQTGKVEFKDL